METRKIYQSLMNINKEITFIGKNQKNQSQNFKFRGIDDILNELHGLFSKHEVLVIPKVTNLTREERTTAKGTVLFYTHLTVDFHFTALDGSDIVCTIIGESMDSGDKGTNKCLSIALKYALLQMFLIPTEEQKDPDSETHEVKAKVLSDIGFSKALKRLSEGEIEIIEKLESAYTLSDAQRKAVAEATNPLKIEKVKVKVNVPKEGQLV